MVSILVFVIPKYAKLLLHAMETNISDWILGWRSAIELITDQLEGIPINPKIKGRLLDLLTILKQNDSPNPFEPHPPIPESAPSGDPVSIAGVRNGIEGIDSSKLRWRVWNLLNQSSSCYRNFEYDGCLSCLVAAVEVWLRYWNRPDQKTKEIWLAFLNWPRRRD
jgi:hypothetical protein